MNRICRKCGNDINEGRLKAIPDTKTCVECSNTNKKKGFKIITGKDTYTELDIVDDETFKELDRYDKTYRQNKV